MSIWLTADTHLGHASLLSFLTRPFATVDEMDAALIAAWNAVVKRNDLVYHLGDFAWRDVKRYREQLAGNIVLIRGNHDRAVKGEAAKCFSAIHDLHRLKIRKRSHEWTPACEATGMEAVEITMCHYAMRKWDKSHFGTFHCYGHSHGDLPPHGRSFDVGVDAWDYRPLSLDEVVTRAMELEPILVHHREAP